MAKRKNQKQAQHQRSTNALVDIIIPVYRRWDLLEKCLQAIPKAAGNIPYQIIVVDNGSPKDEKEYFYKPYLSDSRFVLVENKQNLGFPRACNIGAKRKFASLLFFLNDDVVLEPNSIELLVREMDDPKVGVCGMRLLFPDDVNLYGLRSDQHVRPAGKLQHICLSLDIRGVPQHAFLGWDANHPKIMRLKDVPAVTGAAFMVRRGLYNKVGGFWEGYGLGTFEDVDCCFGIRELGYNIHTVPEAVGVHYTGATAFSEKISYPLSDNALKFKQRWSHRLEWTDWKIL